MRVHDIAFNDIAFNDIALLKIDYSVKKCGHPVLMVTGSAAIEYGLHLAGH
jgi:hypothetical protein